MRFQALHKGLITTAFLLSGAAALVYQIIWQRLFVIFAGADMQATSIIVAAFLFGLGIGSLLGGKLADRFSAGQNLWLFVGAEILIGVWGLCSKWLYYDLLCQQLSTTTHFRPTTLFLIFLTLLPPTLLMGLSLPLLIRSLTLRLPQAAPSIGWLYGANTLGAAVGALLTIWLILPNLGIENGLSIAAIGNAICVFLVAPLLQKNDIPEATEPTVQVSFNPLKPSFRFLHLCLLYSVSGFLALGLEMVWFRVVGVMIKSTAFTFGTLLGIYLAGLGLGSIIGSLRVQHSAAPLRSFLMLQAASAISAVTILIMALWLINQTSWFPIMQTYLGSYEPLNAGSLNFISGEAAAAKEVRLFAKLYLILPLFLIALPTFLMGYSIPFLQKSAQTEMNQIGQRLGWLQAANILGSLLGIVVVSWLFIPYLGSAGTLKALVVTGMFLGGMGLSFQSSPKRVTKVLGAIIAGCLLTMMPGNTQLWALAHGTAPEDFLHVEDSSGISAVQQAGRRPDAAGERVVFVNGIGQSWLPYGGIHSALGALPALLHPKPERIAIIGLGSGDTAYSAAANYRTQKIYCIEIVGGLLENLKSENLQRPSSPLSALLSEGRIEHLHGDGRRFLKMTEHRFDIIEADALRPSSAGSGNLYSEEYFHLISRRLNVGGFAVTWVPTAHVRNAFLRVFPHVLDLGNILIGSPDLIQVDSQDLRRRLGHLEVREHFRKAGIPIQQVLRPYAMLDFKQHLIDAQFDRSQLGDSNTDLFPKDEFARSEL